MQPGELVVEVGAGAGALTRALAQQGARVLAVELDRSWARRLAAKLDPAGDRVRVVQADFLSLELPRRPFRVVGSVPFGRTTDVLRRLHDDPATPLERADLLVQWEVARKRASLPPTPLRSTAWAPWWSFGLQTRIPAGAFVMHAGRRFRIPKSLPTSLQWVTRFLAPNTKAGWEFAVPAPVAIQRRRLVRRRPSQGTPASTGSSHPSRSSSLPTPARLRLRGSSRLEVE